MFRRVLLSLVFCIPGTLSAADDGADAVTRALHDELERSMRGLRLEGLERPYFISYRIEDLYVHVSSAIRGSLVRSSKAHNRLLYVELRVGDYGFDNTNFNSVPSFGSSRMVASFGGVTPLPIEDDYREIRRQVWLATDAAFKEAVETFAKKRAALKNRVRTETLPDFSRGEVVSAVSLDATPPAPLVATTQSARLATELSALMRDMPYIYLSEVSYGSTVRKVRYLNSEGTRFSRTISDVVIATTATLQTEDGILLEDAVTVFGQRPEDLPAPAELANRIVAMGERLALRRDADSLERYNGPVLFEPEAAAEVLAQVFVPNLVAQRRPVAGVEQLGMYDDDEWTFNDRLGGRVLPRFLSLVDDPKASVYAGAPLFGGYPIDDEGVMAQTTLLVDRGFLETLLVGRTPVSGVTTSNGHHRAGGVVPSNLIFTVVHEGKTSDELRDELLRLVEERGSEFGVLVKRIGNPFFSPADRPTNRLRYGSRGGGAVGPINTAFKIYPDGSEVLLRQVEVTGISPQIFREIVAAGNELRVVHRPFQPIQGNPFALGSFTDEIPLISMVVPALLFEEVTLRVPEGDRMRPSLVEPFTIGAAKLAVSPTPARAVTSTKRQSPSLR